MYNIIVVSDGTGRTAQQALDAALTQFPGIKPEVIVRPGVRTYDQVEKVVQEAAEKQAIILHTIVSDEMRSVIVKLSRKYNVERIDIMGPLLMRLSHHFKDISPSEKPGLFHKLNKDYFRRIEAMEYTFRHDDGMRHSEIDKADIVILGVSRTFKTPLSIYLATKGWFVANIPIILNINPPDSLYKVNPSNVFCLMTNPKHLSQLRKSRHEHLGGITGNYAEYMYVAEELKFALRLYRSQPKWTIINVTGKSIEEIASEILALKRKNDNTTLNPAT